MFERTYNQGMLVYDQQLYDDLYSARVSDGRIIHYSREFLNLQDPPHWQRQMEVLDQLDISMGDGILIVGCGFSPLLTAFRSKKVWGTDPSPFIQEHKDTESDAPERIWPYRVPDRRIPMQGNWRFVITDDVCPGYPADPIVPIGGTRSNPELEEFLAGCSSLSPQVVHFVTPEADEGPGDPRLTWLSISEWASFAPDHTWIDNVTLEVWNAN